MRTCPCDHSYPLCACSEGLSGDALLRRSNFLSSLAGWPGQVDPAEAAAVLATYGRPAPVPPSAPIPPAKGDCGCGGRK